MVSPVYDQVPKAPDKENFMYGEHDSICSGCLALGPDPLTAFDKRSITCKCSSATGGTPKQHSPGAARHNFYEGSIIYVRRRLIALLLVAAMIVFAILLAVFHPNPGGIKEYLDHARTLAIALLVL